MSSKESKFTLPSAERVLVVMAHPDDPEFGAGGTIARLTKRGSEVIYAVVTDGSKGSEEESFTHELLFHTRQEEQRRAASILGVKDVHFLGFPDAQIYNNEELREALVRQIRMHRPDLLITHDPTTRFWRGNRINHPDHRAVGDCTLDAVFPLARDRLNFLEHEKEGLPPHKTLDILLTGSNEANFAVDVSEVLETKLEAITAHTSQIKKPDELRARVTDYQSTLGQEWGMPYAEVFRRITLPG